MKLKNPSQSICNVDTYGPTFGGGYDLYIADGKRNDNYSNLGDNYELPPGYTYGSQQAKSLLAGANQFTIDEYEVFYDAKGK